VANLRVALEPDVARLAAESTDLNAHREVPVQMTKLWETVDGPKPFAEADLAFHRSIFLASGNELLLCLYEVVSEALRLVRPLHTHSVAHNRETLPNDERAAQAVLHGHHRKAVRFMRTRVEVARSDAPQRHSLTAEPGPRS
jgi:GntR family galactonate operon transcriptional repressor